MRYCRLIASRPEIFLLIIFCLGFGLTRGENEGVMEGLLLSPPKGAIITSFPIHFDWNDVNGANPYNIQVDNNSSFASPEADYQTSTSFILIYDNVLPQLGTYYWRIRSRFYNAGDYYWGDWSHPWYFTIMEATDVGDNDSPGLPGDFKLEQNFPNPFNLSTTIEYYLPRASMVTLDIYDILGRNLKTIDDGAKKSGPQKTIWDGTDSEGKPVASGVYFYRLKAGEFISTKKMQLLK